MSTSNDHVQDQHKRAKCSLFIDPNKLLNSKQRTSGLGDDVSAELHNDAAEGSAVGGDVEVNLGIAGKLISERVRNARARQNRQTAPLQYTVSSYISGYDHHQHIRTTRTDLRHCCLR